jgi:hypothetical protein
MVKNIYFFISSILTLWGGVSPGVKPTTNLQLVPRANAVEVDLHAYIRLHGVVIN